MCNVIEKCKAMNLKFEVRSCQEERVKENWLLTDLFEEKLVKQSVKARIDLEIVGLNQIMDSTGSELMMWKQIKVSRGRSMKGKVAHWFSRLEEEVLRSSNSRELKKEYMLEVENYVASLPQLEKLQDD